MAWAVNVVFSPGGKVYSFDPNGLELAWDERVICGTSRGPEIARVVTGNHELERSPREQPLAPARAARAAAAPDRAPCDVRGRGARQGEQGDRPQGDARVPRPPARARDRER